MSPEHLQRMQEGRRRQIERRAAHAAQRVQAFNAWLAAGSPRGIPQVPSDADFQLARKAA